MTPCDRRGVDPARLRASLLTWYDRHGRDLPWRARRGTPPDPYRVWLSEIMPAADRRRHRDPLFRAVPRALAEPARSRRRRARSGPARMAGAGLLRPRAPAPRMRPGRARHAWGGPVSADRAGAARASRHRALYPPARSRPSPSSARPCRSTAMSNACSPASSPSRCRCRPPSRPCGASRGEFAAADRAGDCAQALMDLGATVCVPRAPRCGPLSVAGAPARGRPPAAGPRPCRAAPPRPERPAQIRRRVHRRRRRGRAVPRAAPPTAASSAA